MIPLAKQTIIDQLEEARGFWDDEIDVDTDGPVDGAVYLAFRHRVLVPAGGASYVHDVTQPVAKVDGTRSIGDLMAGRRRWHESTTAIRQMAIQARAARPSASP